MRKRVREEGGFALGLQWGEENESGLQRDPSSERARFSHRICPREEKAALVGPQLQDAGSSEL